MAASPGGLGLSATKTPTVKELQTALYTKCRSHPNRLYDQDDLLNLKVIPDNSLEILIQCAQGLTNQNLFRVHRTSDGKIGWKVVKEDDAAKYSSLSEDERMVYSVIDSSANTGIWTKHIKLRTNLHQTVVTRCLKSLEQKTLIKTVRNVKHPSQKIYMVFGLQPAEDVTGGAWFTDGVLDEVLIKQLGDWVVRWVASKSWFASHPHPSTGPGGAVELGRTTKVDAKGKGKQVDITSGGAKKGPLPKTRENITYLPFPPGYIGYPTTRDVTRAIADMKAIEVDLNDSTTQQLLDVLCYDGHLVKIQGGKAYKSVRTPAGLKLEDEENPLMQAPCGRCPVFNLCEEGGPVNAGNCEYFQDWLEIF